jgi:hypothetical protein
MATSAGATRAADQITFAHNSERQFARLLDFYRVEWEYEPTAFPIEWDAAGRPVQHFRPDFYLPRFGLYIEITTLNQRLVTKKNRKVRRLRELYPDVRIKVLYQRDYLSLLAKYGLEPPSQMLTPEAGPNEARPAAAGSGAAGPGATRGFATPGPAAAGANGGSPQGGSPRDQPPQEGSPQGGSLQGGPTREARPPRAGSGPVAAARRVPEGVGGPVERARAAGRPRVLPDPPQPPPPLPADPELVRLAQVLLPAEEAHRRGPAVERAG